MTPERWTRIKNTFHAALEVAPHDRDAFLNERCASDSATAEVRAEVDRLLAAHQNAASFIEVSPVAPAAGRTSTLLTYPSMTGHVIGRYRIGSRIGVGGMGEVYVARDQELGRDVAVKVAIGDDEESLLRLRQEAQHASRLNHPHICTIHEVGAVDGRPFIIMELVEGPTLAERIALGPIGVDDALTLARQILGALDEAHTQGVIHRDLKPANVKVRPDGTVKILDFGLAKLSRSPTGATPPPTTAGMILGTPAYMSPEQLRGEPADKRTDIWAFGCVLFEMLTGQQAFGRATISDTVAAVLTAEPAWDRVPTSFRRLLRWCLERDVTERLRDIGDARVLLDDTGADAAPAAPARGRRELWAWSAAAVLSVTTAVALGLHLRAKDPVAPQVRFDIQPPGDQTFAPFAFAPSPDGRNLAFLTDGSDSGRRSLWIYSIAAGVSREVAKVDMAGTSALFWAPDGRSIGLSVDGKILRADVGSGSVQKVCDVPSGVIGTASWSRDNVIVFGVMTREGNDGLMRVSASGGTPVRLTQANRSGHELGHSNPIFLPDGRSFLYQTVTAEGLRDLYVGSVDAGSKQSAEPVLSLVGPPVRYSPSPNPERGYVLFLRDGKLMAQAFDNRRLMVVGSAAPLPGQSSSEITSREFAASADVLMYRRLSRPRGALVWVDRQGRQESVLDGAFLDAPEFPRLSPDGSRLALVVNGDIWVYDLDGRPPIKLTFDGTSFAPLWTADGRRLVYESPLWLSSIAADGSDRTPQRASRNGHYHPHAWSRDGRELIVVQLLVGALSSISTMPADGQGEPRSVVEPTSGGVDGPVLSPDGRWLAYTSDSTGRREIWVQPFPTGAPVRISPNGGVEPLWAKSGRELFYLEGKKMMSVVVDPAPRFTARPPVVLFEGTYLRPIQPPSYDVSHDGRFLMIKPSAQPEIHITSILNWTEALNLAGSMR